MTFFGTSFGKEPCDGVDGTVKRLAARASLQKLMTNRIQTPLLLYTNHMALSQIR